jgi:putative membrane protein
MHHDTNCNKGVTGFVWISLVLFCLFLLYRIFDNSNKGKSFEKESPLDILKRRYANGEIATVEYEERKKALEDH